MKCLLLLLFAFYGDFTIATAPQPTAPLSPNVDIAGVMRSRGQLVHTLQNDLKDTHLMQQLATHSRHFDDYFETYSQSVTPMVTELKSIIMRGGDNVFDATLPVFGWCANVKTLLEAYVSLPDGNNEESIEAKNDIVQSLFSENITTIVSNELKKLLNNLNSANGTVASLSTQFEADFSEDSAFFERTLRNEFVKEKNKSYTPDLIDRIIEALKKLRKEQLQEMQEIAKAAGKILPIVLSSPPDLNALQDLSYTYLQDLPQDPTAPTRAPAPIDPQKYLPYRNRVVFRFGQTKAFFKNFERLLNEMIQHVNNVELKLSENNQLELNARQTENAASVQTNATTSHSNATTGHSNSTTVPLTAEQTNQAKSAAQKLISRCTSFNSIPLRHNFRS